MTAASEPRKPDQPTGLRARLAALKEKAHQHHAAHHAARNAGVGRPPAPPDEVSRRVLDAACEQYMRLGFNAVTTDDTARAAGISKKTLYQHFASKDELLRNVVRENLE